MYTFVTARWISIILTILVGCGQGAPAGERSLDKDAALREWRRNETILAKAIEGESREDQLLSALIFFQELTGITVRGDGTTVGYLLDEAAKEDLVRLQDWCKRHCDELYWDEESQRVKRLPPGEDGG
jgi:hypothetical protein